MSKRIVIYIATPSVGGYDVFVSDITENPKAYQRTIGKHLKTLDEVFKYIEKEVRGIIKK